MTSQLPPTSFLGSRSARVALARQRFFEEGLLPTGVVTEAVFQSWSRCLRLHRRPCEQAVFEPVTASRAHLALQKNRHLLEAWLEVSPTLETVLGTTSCAAMLTDHTGVIIGACCAGRAHEELMPVATRIGVDLSEEAVGTTAPGVVARTGKPVCVLGPDHFFENVRNMQCAAAPIRDITGSVAGVLDLSSEAIPFNFDAAALAGLYAGAIENRLLIAQSTDHLVIRLQVAEELLDSALVGLVGIDSRGRLAWHNGAARRLLGVQSSAEAHRHDIESSLSLTVSQLASLPAAGAAMLTLPNGLLVWARAEMRSPDGLRKLVTGSPVLVNDLAAVETVAPTQVFPSVDDASKCESIAAAVVDPSSWPGRPTTNASATLRESDRELISRTLQACDGNVSEAAKSLGVSRNLIYRRLRRVRSKAAEGH